jgi:hypothetical protein
MTPPNNFDKKFYFELKVKNQYFSLRFPPVPTAHRFARMTISTETLSAAGRLDAKHLGILFELKNLIYTSFREKYI